MISSIFAQKLCTNLRIFALLKMEFSTIAYCINAAFETIISASDFASVMENIRASHIEPQVRA